MRIAWQRGSGDDLLVFCNGWGMDETVVAHLGFAGDVVVLSDFTSLYSDKLPADLVSALAAAPRRLLIAWSMGVWVAPQLFACSGPVSFARRVAVNGTLRPVDDEFGIPIRLFRGTLEQFDETTRRGFYRRMCGSRAVEEMFAARQPQRSLDSQRQELDFYWQHRSIRPENCYDTAVIATKDRIVPTANLRRFWQGADGVQPVEIGGGHFPFSALSRWEQLLERGGA